MTAKRVRVVRMEDSLMKRVLDSVADELQISKSRLNDALASKGFTDILKQASQAEVPFSRDVERSVVGVAHTEQAERTAASLKAWVPRDQFAEDKIQKPLRLGPIERAKPTYTHEGVDVESRGFPGGSPYQAALKAVKKGSITTSDIRAVLKMGGGLDPEIEEICKSLNAIVDKIDVDLKKTARAQREWELAWNETMKQHERVIEG